MSGTKITIPEATTTNKFHAVRPPRIISKTHNANHKRPIHTRRTIFEPLIFITHHKITYKFNEKFADERCVDTIILIDRKKRPAKSLFGDVSVCSLCYIIMVFLTFEHNDAQLVKAIQRECDKNKREQIWRRNYRS